MSSNQLAIIVDSTDPTINYSWQWSRSPQESIWYNGTYSYFTTSTGNASFYYVFQGTSISIFGHADGQALATVDNNPTVYTPVNSSFQIYRPWYISPSGLSDSQHVIKLEFATAVYLDCFTITAGQTTPLQGRVLIVDDSDPALNYTGSWTVGYGQTFELGDGFEHRPYQQTTHQSKHPGDYVTFQFTGTSVSVMGVIQWDIPGHVSTAYTIDGSDPPYTNTIQSQGDGRPWSEQPNFQFYHTDLDPGNHSLVITVTEITKGQLFTLDYILYNASFANIIAKPNLTYADLHPWKHPPIIHSSKSTPIGAIAGGTVAGVVVIGILVGFLFFWRRRKRHEGNQHRTPREEIDPSPPQEQPGILDVIHIARRETSHSPSAHGATTESSFPSSQSGHLLIPSRTDHRSLSSPTTHAVSSIEFHPSIPQSPLSPYSPTTPHPFPAVTSPISPTSPRRRTRRPSTGKSEKSGRSTHVSTEHAGSSASHPQSPRPPTARSEKSARSNFSNPPTSPTPMPRMPGSGNQPADEVPSDLPPAYDAS